jgi:UDP-N-acetylglucosamine 1-carboxyvinyltransferase
MEKFLISGGKKLKGRVRVSGAKNAALPIMASALLSEGSHRIRRVPSLRDIFTMGRLLEHLGGGFSFSDSTGVINTGSVNRYDAPYDLVRTMRASILVLGPLLARYGRANVSLPGGCAIGARPINLHLIGLEKMGAHITLERGYVRAKARRLKAGHIYFDFPTVTGTENVMMAAALADGTTRLENAAHEPEVKDLADALTSMGARISGAGESVVEIEGVKELQPLDYEIIPDRIETGTYMLAAGVTGGDVVIEDARHEHLEASIAKLQEAGMQFEYLDKGIRVVGPDRPVATDAKTMPYPGFPTDMQAQFIALMSIADGTSLITETIFENRFMHVAELRRMGADITVEGATATVKGVKALKGAPVMATDLRASASLVLAALAARGETLIDRIYHIDRGYDSIESKLRRLGVRIKRIKD